MSNRNNRSRRITNQNRIQRRRYNRISAITVVTTVCVLATSITVIAAPMKSNTDTVQKKVSLPHAGINKVVANYAELADEADISLLAADIMEDARTATVGKEEDVKNTDAIERSVKADVVEKSVRKTLEQPVEPETEAVYEEPVYIEEPVYEEPQEIVYEEPVYEEPVEEYVEEAPAEVFLAEDEYAEEPVEEVISDEDYLNDEEYSEEDYTEDDSEENTENAEEIYYEEETFMDEVLVPEYTEETPDQPETYEEDVVYEEETLADFLEAQDAAIEEQAAEKAAKTQEPAVDASSDTYLGNIIAQDACQYAGWLPYVWAGDSLETGADCSGFTMAVYAKYGILLSHDSEVQSCEGVSVPLSEALPGDIVVYSGHVAMYIGNGQIVHSPTPGQCVTITNVDMMPVLDVRRMIS